MKLAAFISLLTAAAALGQIKEVRRTVPLSPNGHVQLESFKGEIRVTAWDQPQVEIYARIEADGTSSEDLRLVNETDVRIDSTSDSLHLKSDYPNRHMPNNTSLPFVRYTIHMPRTAELRIKDYKSEIEVTALHAALEIETYKGDSTVRNLSGSMRLNTYKGHANIQIDNMAGNNSFETYKGVLDIALPQNAHFNVISESGPRANIRSSFAFTLPAGTYGARGGHLQAQVNGGGPELVLKSYHGDVNLH